MLARRARSASSEVPVGVTPPVTKVGRAIDVDTVVFCTTPLVSVEVVKDAGDMPSLSFMLRSLAEGVSIRLGSIASMG